MGPMIEQEDAWCVRAVCVVFLESSSLEEDWMEDCRRGGWSGGGHGAHE